MNVIKTTDLTPGMRVKTHTGRTVTVVWVKIRRVQATVRVQCPKIGDYSILTTVGQTWRVEA